ncbi:hypothetical protein MGMO_47c00100 [Methyloglobulus morosus KoM1]|uniref:Lipoprotein n=1 Tax=Methyloglobulus morosus KoM1 TaxID=1116472 RepID=V5C7M9_9GAMM|nr:DUF3574 domain-containing protein [Methyloglobulus morosus]ESS72743.1 hypothetical protein MGMO_47c00100 [Methyloglobulus morosus KoM1]
MVRNRIIATLSVLLLLAGCAAIPQISCPAGEERSVNELLYFGTAKPNGVVTSQEWEEFLRTSITPRFPKGLTFWRAFGQWQNSGKTIIREASFVVSLVHSDDELSAIAVHAIITEYKLRFDQEAVLRVKGYACVGK